LAGVFERGLFGGLEEDAEWLNECMEPEIFILLANMSISTTNENKLFTPRVASNLSTKPINSIVFTGVH
jgi:hypothetical protein